MQCKYCDTEHPADQIANPHYCVARLSEKLEAIEEEKDKKIAALTAENKRLRQIVVDCHAGWPDEVLQVALRGKEEDYASSKG